MYNNDLILPDLYTYQKPMLENNEPDIQPAEEYSELKRMFQSKQWKKMPPAELNEAIQRFEQLDRMINKSAC